MVNRAIGHRMQTLATSADLKLAGRKIKIAIALAALSQVAVIVGLAWLFS